jgi:hypothetical protein
MNDSRLNPREEKYKYKNAGARRMVVIWFVKLKPRTNAKKKRNLEIDESVDICSSTPLIKNKQVRTRRRM